MPTIHQLVKRGRKLRKYKTKASQRLNPVGRSTASAGILASRTSRVRALKNAREFAEEANSLAPLKTLRF